MRGSEILDRCPVCGEPTECEKYWHLRGGLYCFFFRCLCIGGWKGKTWRRIMTLEEARRRSEAIIREEEAEMARNLERELRHLELAERLREALCKRCVFWDGYMCRATPRGRYSLGFKPEEGKCADFIEEVMVVVEHGPICWVKVGRREGRYVLLSAAAMGPYRPLDRPIAHTGGGVAFDLSEVGELIEAIRSKKGGGRFMVVAPEDERRYPYVISRTDAPGRFYFFKEDEEEIIRALERLRARTSGR